MRFIKALLAALALICAWPAHATILFAGGEDVDFTFFGTPGIDTTAGQFRSSYSRLAIAPLPPSVADPPGIRIVTPAFANQTTIWIHAEAYTNANAINAGAQAATVYGSDGVRRLMIRASGTNTVKISTRNTAGTITDLVTCTASWPIAGQLSKLDWYVNYAVAGHTTLYINGVQICDYTGDVTTNSVTAVNQVDLASLNISTLGTGWSEVIISTTDTRDMNLMTCFPSANGTNMTWTGSYTNVSPTTVSDPSAITTSSTSAIAEFTCPTIPAGAFTVPAVTQSARVQIGTTGPQNFRYIARPSSGSTDYDSGSDILGATNFTSYTGQIWATNPATSTSWTTGDLQTGVNFGLKSRP